MNWETFLVGMGYGIGGVLGAWLRTRDRDAIPRLGYRLGRTLRLRRQNAARHRQRDTA